MMKIQGYPKSSALFYWTEQNSAEKEKTYFASFLTISPVELEAKELPFQEGVSFTYPIMVHEPIPTTNIERIISDARERNAAIVDCGRTTVKSIRARMKKALGEYLQLFIMHYIDMEQKQEEMASKQLVDINFENIKKKLRRAGKEERMKKTLELIEKIRIALKEKKPAEEIEKMRLELSRLRPETEPDFDNFIDVVGNSGKIADKVVELYTHKLRRQTDPEEEKCADECEEELQSLFILHRLDRLREKARKNLGKPEKAIEIIQEIFRIKNLNPPFASAKDLDHFSNILTERGRTAGEISKKYIEKYFKVIERDFKKAGDLHKQIQQQEEKFFNQEENN